MKKIFLLALISLMLAACGSTNTDNTGQSEVPVTGNEGQAPLATGTTAGMMEQDVDQMFMNMMIPHHQSAIEMGELALARAELKELKDFSRKMIDSQQQEIEQMQGWLSEWYNDAEVPDMKSMPLMPEMKLMPGMEGMEDMNCDCSMMNMEAEIQQLSDTPENFDLAFIDKMIPHHQMAIEAAQMVLDQGQHQELKDMAQKMIEEQQGEIETLTQFRTEWYPDAPPPQKQQP